MNQGAKVVITFQNSETPLLHAEILDGDAHSVEVTTERGPHWLAGRHLLIPWTAINYLEIVKDPSEASS